MRVDIDILVVQRVSTRRMGVMHLGRTRIRALISRNTSVRAEEGGGRKCLSNVGQNIKQRKNKGDHIGR